MSGYDFVVAGIAVFLIMNFASFFAIHLKRNDVADVVWGPGFLISGVALLIYKLWSDPNFQVHARMIVVLGLVGAWALRLFFHIGLRTIKASHEDARYAKMRQGWSAKERVNSYTRVFLLQGVIMYLVALPIYIIIASDPHEIGLECYFGVAVWIFGFIIESLADHQLTSFKKDFASKGKIMDRGLWGWSRHPNYFGEIIQWWGIFILTLPLNFSWLAVLSPLAITFLILKVSGVTMLEKQMQNRPGYKEYQARTSQFILWPPKST